MNTDTAHILVVTEDRRYLIECPGVTTSCCQWQGCETCPTDFEAVDPETGDEIEATERAHGVEHRWQDGEWITPLDRCFMAAHPDVADAASDLGLSPGRHPVEYDQKEAREDYYGLYLRLPSTTPVP